MEESGRRVDFSEVRMFRSVRKDNLGGGGGLHLRDVEYLKQRSLTMSHVLYAKLPPCSILTSHSP